MLHHQLNEEMHHALKNLYIPATVYVKNCKNESLAILNTPWNGKVQQTLHLSLYTYQNNPTLMMAFHQPHASCSLAREYTSISWFSVKSGFPVPPGGRRTWENGNLDSGCQLKNKQFFTRTLQLLDAHFLLYNSIYSALI